MRDPLGVPRTLEVVAVVKGVARAQAVIDDFTKTPDGSGKEVRNLFLLGIHVESDPVENEQNMREGRTKRSDDWPLT